MKKLYQKPEILFEDFTLNTSISAGCEILVTNSAKGSCGYVLRSGGTVFVDGNSGCFSIEADGIYGDENNQICYHVPIETNNLFNS